jgi:hypothetical protein
MEVQVEVEECWVLAGRGRGSIDRTGGRSRLSGHSERAGRVGQRMPTERRRAVLVAAAAAASVAE